METIGTKGIAGADGYAVSDLVGTRRDGDGHDYWLLGSEWGCGLKWLAREINNTIPRESNVPLSNWREGKVWVMKTALSALVIKVAGTNKLVTRVAGACLRAVYQHKT